LDDVARMAVVMVRTQISLEEEQYEFLKEEAGRSGASMSEVIRRAVEALRRSGDRRRVDALRLLGAFEADCADAAAHHDRYLSNGAG
jgi:Arc/MetJ-type ribon-helix-helix transcriptional regulator